MAILPVIPLLLAGLVACNEHVVFNQVAQDFVNRKSAEKNLSVEWWDLYAKHKDMAKYQQYKIRTWVEQTHYGPVQSSFTAPGYTYTQWYHNGGSEDITSKFTRKVDVIDTFSWSITRGIKFGHSLSIGVDVPELFSASSSLSLEMNTDQTDTTTRSKNRSHSVESTITIPANTSVKATLTTTNQLMDIPFNTTVHVEGWIAIWYTHRWRGHYLYFSSIGALAEGHVQAIGPNHLVYHQEGMFHGSRGITYDFKVEQFPSDGEPVSH